MNDMSLENFFIIFFLLQNEQRSCSWIIQIIFMEILASVWMRLNGISKKVHCEHLLEIFSFIFSLPFYSFVLFFISTRIAHSQNVSLDHKKLHNPASRFRLLITQKSTEKIVQEKKSYTWKKIFLYFIYITKTWKTRADGMHGAAMSLEIIFKIHKYSIWSWI